MVHYKLTYFNAQGRGERIRMLFLLAGQEFEDIRISQEEWIKMKPNTPYGQLPILEEDGLAGKTAWEEAKVDEVVDLLLDFFDETRPFWQTAFKEKFEELPKLKEEVLRPSCKKNLAFLTNILTTSGHGWMIGESLTFCDIAVALFSEGLDEHAPEILNEYSELRSHMERFRAIPSIQEWIEKRPKTPW